MKLFLLTLGNCFCRRGLCPKYRASRLCLGRGLSAKWRFSDGMLRWCGSSVDS